MKLYNDHNWKAVHFADGRTILSTDYYHYGKLDWEELIYDIEVEPMQTPGHYRVKEA